MHTRSKKPMSRVLDVASVLTETLAWDFDTASFAFPNGATVEVPTNRHLHYVTMAMILNGLARLRAGEFGTEVMTRFARNLVTGFGNRKPASFRDPMGRAIDLLEAHQGQAVIMLTRVGKSTPKKEG